MFTNKKKEKWTYVLVDNLHNNHVTKGRLLNWFARNWRVIEGQYSIRTVSVGFANKKDAIFFSLGFK